MTVFVDKEFISYGEYEGKQIDELVLSDKVKSIGELAFFKNAIKEIAIPDSVEYIGKYAFDFNVIILYKKQIFTEAVTKKYGIENIVKITQILDILSKTITLRNIDYYFSKELLENMYINSDNVKSYMANFNIFNNYVLYILKEMNVENTDNNYSILYKIFYIFGFFNCKDKEAIFYNILKFLKANNFYKIIEIASILELKEYNKNLATILNDNSENKHMLEILSKMYDDFPVIVDDILLRKTNQLKKINAEYKKTGNENTKEEYQKLRKEKKKISLSDIINYIKHKSYLEENSAFSSIASIIYRTVSQEDIIKMNKIYMGSLSIQDNQYFVPIKKRKENIYFEWIENKDLMNFILGYLCDCCAKIGDDGETIVIQSMTNPLVKNLVIYDLNDEVLAKTTALYNPNYKTIIFNGVMIPKVLRKNDYIKAIVLDAIFKATQLQVSIMEDEGIDVREIRMESFDNHLNDLLKHYPIAEQNYENILNDRVKQKQYILYRR